jgi:hypothetical protein
MLAPLGLVALHNVQELFDGNDIGDSNYRNGLDIVHLTTAGFKFGIMKRKRLKDRGKACKQTEKER